MSRHRCAWQRAGLADKTKPDIWHDEQSPFDEDDQSRKEDDDSVKIFDAADVLTKFIRPRGWLLGVIFCKQFLSSLVGAGATGKTALRLVQALSLATGRALSGDYVHRRCKVLILCFEDGREELERRVKAALMHHNVGEEVRGWLFCSAITGQKIFEGGNPGSLMAWVRSKIQKLGSDLRSLCENPENHRRDGRSDLPDHQLPPHPRQPRGARPDYYREFV